MKMNDIFTFHGKLWRIKLTAIQFELSTLPCQTFQLDTFFVSWLRTCIYLQMYLFKLFMKSMYMYFNNKHCWINICKNSNISFFVSWLRTCIYLQMYLFKLFMKPMYMYFNNKHCWINIYKNSNISFFVSCIRTCIHLQMYLFNLFMKPMHMSSYGNSI